MTEAELAERRDRMTLAQRVTARRELDRAAGITYPPLTVRAADRIARALTS